MKVRGQVTCVVSPSAELGDRQAAGIIAIADPIKETTPDALQALYDEGVSVVMLTGDNWKSARAVAKRLGINEVEAEILPEDKSKVVARLRRAGRIVAMAGDGVNDAPALAAAVSASPWGPEPTWLSRAPG